MAYSVHIESFEGPLDLLLQLVEGEKMDITSVSLMEVTEPFVRHVQEKKGQIPPEELADFLVVAAKLVYLKSKALLPDLADTGLEEGPDLETQLRLYKAFVEASSKIAALERGDRPSFSRIHRPYRQEEVIFTPPTGVTASLLQELYMKAVQRLEPLLALPKAALERAITIEEMISRLRERISRGLHTSFHRVLRESHDRHEMVVSFLALLELIKQRIVSVEQDAHFTDIRLRSNA